MEEKIQIGKEYNNLWTSKLSKIADYCSKQYKIPGNDPMDLFHDIYIYGYKKYEEASEGERKLFSKPSYFKKLVNNYLIDQYRKYYIIDQTNQVTIKKIDEVSIENEEGETIDIVDDSLSPLDIIILKEQKRILHKAIELLKSADDQKLVNGIIMGKESNEIAKELNLTINNYNVRKKRVIDKLRVIVKDIEKENTIDKLVDIAGTGLSGAIGGIVGKGILTSVLGNRVSFGIIVPLIYSIIEYFKKSPKTTVVNLVCDLLENDA